MKIELNRKEIETMLLALGDLSCDKAQNEINWHKNVNKQKLQINKIEANEIAVKFYNKLHKELFYGDDL